MNLELLAKMKDHAEHGCGIAKPLLAAVERLEELRTSGTLGEDTLTLGLVRAVEQVAEAVTAAHLDSDAKVLMIMEWSQAADKAIRYLAAGLDSLAAKVTMPSAHTPPGDPRVN